MVYSIGMIIIVYSIRIKIRPKTLVYSIRMKLGQNQSGYHYHENKMKKTIVYSTGMKVCLKVKVYSIRMKIKKKS